MTNIYHATPYDISATGFYFKTYDEYAEKAANHTNAHGSPVEEYEIQFIDGDNYKLFEALCVNQANLKQWFDDFEGLFGDDFIKALYLAEDLNCSIDEVLDHMDDVCLFEGSAQEYAEQFIEETGMLDEIPENLRCYFDTEAFARDLVISGDVTEVEIDGISYIAWGH
ncbi:antirestriction protein ArdA [Kordiimonas sp. SCSIO 12603]|uniref:antirestriction protein ArdA n=1 Tax=Kordiimonas sp. SCSIO 12603 TaxID=2829596 RepID=UPI0021048211|nr:antirestriction protein ArdA [Kordiimonas sp. SCSIO 12603]UTW58843.1 antirestriction protein ArdA [Kordiimonas sp. SCSIO 12603]